MGRKTTTIPFNPVFLKSAMVQKGISLTDAAEKLGISRQAVNAWFMEERIPPRRMSDLAEWLELDAKLLREILDKQDSPKDMAREIRKLREENQQLKDAIRALITEPADPTSKEGESRD